MASILTEIGEHPGVNRVFFSLQKWCYWECGRIVVPEACWVDVRQQIIHHYNTWQDEYLKRSREVHRLAHLCKGMRESYRSAFVNAQTINESYSSVFLTLISPILFPADRRRDRIYKPLRRDFPHATRRTRQLQYGPYGTLTVGDRLLDWRYLGSAEGYALESIPDLMNILASVPYVEGTGGIIYTAQGSVGLGSLGRNILTNNARCALSHM